MNHSNKKSSPAIIVIAMFVAFYGGVVSNGQNQPSNTDEVRSKIIPSHEIWLEYSKLKETPSSAQQRSNSIATRQTNQTQPNQSSNIGGVQNKITPSHEIWLEYEKLKYDMSPAGIEEWKRKQEVEKAAAEEAARKQREAEKQAIAERAEQRRKEAAEKAEQIRKELAAQAAVEQAAREQKEAEEKAAAEKAAQERMAAERERQRREAEERERNRPVDLQAEVQRSGFRDRISSSALESFLEYGSLRLYDTLNEAEQRRRNADKFDDKAIARAEAEVNAAKAAIQKAQAYIASKTFVAEYTYYVDDDNNYGDGSSSFDLVISTKIKHTKIGAVSFPMQNVTGEHNDTAIWGIRLSVKGSTNSIRELVGNRNNYRVRVYFKNLRHTGGLHDLAADVQKIEIIKVR